MNNSNIRLPFLDRSILRCNMFDIVSGKIPNIFLKSRKLKTGVVFVHLDTDEILYPSSITRYSISKDTGEYHVFDHDEIGKFDETVNLNYSVSRSKNDMKLDDFSMISFNESILKGDLFHIIFSVIGGTKVYDELKNISVYFIDSRDENDYIEFLEKNYVIL